MSGYDRHPDYGGPPPTRREIVLTIVACMAIGLGWLWLTH